MQIHSSVLKGTAFGNVSHAMPNGPVQEFKMNYVLTSFLSIIETSITSCGFVTICNVAHCKNMVTQQRWPIGNSYLSSIHETFNPKYQLS